MISNVRRLISRTRTKRTNKSRRLSRKNLIQEQEGGMNWLTYSKGTKQDPIENKLKPLCVKLNLKNSKNQASINLLKEFIINPYSVLRTPGVILQFLKNNQIYKYSIIYPSVNDRISVFYVKNIKYSQRCKG